MAVKTLEPLTNKQALANPPPMAVRVAKKKPTPQTITQTQIVRQEKAR